MIVKGNKVQLRFDHVGGGLTTGDGRPLTHFEIAGGDRKFVPAEAVIDGQSVVVSNDQVPEPVAVRFAWHQEAQPNFRNQEGLPASPFRTDAW
jgi:sialate O-acetylesterase